MAFVERRSTGRIDSNNPAFTKGRDTDRRCGKTILLHQRKGYENGENQAMDRRKTHDKMPNMNSHNLNFSVGRVAHSFSRKRETEQYGRLQAPTTSSAFIFRAARRAKRTISRLTPLQALPSPTSPRPRLPHFLSRSLAHHRNHPLPVPTHVTPLRFARIMYLEETM